jgi:uncharacterized membrane protein
MGRLIRRYFITGVLVLLPLAVTIYLVWLGFSLTDNLFSELIFVLFRKRIPGAGTLLTLILIFVVGIITTNVIGRRLFAYFERLFIKIPIVSGIYRIAKQIVDVFGLDKQQGFDRVVLVEYPRPGIYAVGFLTQNNLKAFSKAMGKEMVSVFIPTTPNPTSGFFVLMPKEQIIPMSISLEEGFKLIISAGTTISPDDPMIGVLSGEKGG